MTPSETSSTLSSGTSTEGNSRTNDGGTSGRGGSGRGYGSGRGSGRGSGYRTGDRRTAASAIAAVQNADKNFEGNVTEIGVIGLPIESNLRNVLLYENFIQAVVLYVLREYKKGADLKHLLERLEDPLPHVGEKPMDPSDTDQKSPFKLREWEIKYKKWDSLQDQCKDNMVKLYGLLYGQCSSTMKIEIKSQGEYDEKAMESDSL